MTETPDALPPRALGDSLAPRTPEAPASPTTTSSPEFTGQDWQRGGSDPTTPALELDPDRLAAMLPRSRWS